MKTGTAASLSCLNKNGHQMTVCLIHTNGDKKSCQSTGKLKQ